MILLTLLCTDFIKHFIQFVILNRGLFWNFILINLHNPTYFILIKCSPMFQRVPCIILWNLHTSGYSFNILRIFNFKLIHDDSVVWIFRCKIGPPYMFSGHFIIIRNEKYFFMSNQSHIYVLQPSVKMVKDNIVVQNEEVQDKHKSINDYQNDSSCKSCFTCFLIIIAQLKNFSFCFSHCNVNYHNQERISYCSKTPPNK